MISSDTWFVQFDGQVYGPFTTEQMQAYIAEGRIVRDSLVSTNTQQAFRHAQDFVSFANLKRPPNPAPTSTPLRDNTVQPFGTTQKFDKVQAFGKLEAVRPETYDIRSDDIFELSNPIEETVAYNATRPHRETRQMSALELTANDIVSPEHAASKIGTGTETGTGTGTGTGKPTTAERIEPNSAAETVILIMAEIKTKQTMGFLKALQLCGVAERIGHSVWLVRTPLSASQLRNRLSYTIGKTDRLFIMDSYNGKTAWFNIGSDMDARIRKLWQTPKT